MSLRARRFFSAFYTWSTITSTHAVHHNGRRTRLFSNTRAARKNTRARSVDRGKRNFEKRVEEERFGTRTLETYTDDAWANVDVQTSTEKPFDTFEPWEEVVRYSSPAGIMLQLSVPSTVVDDLWKRHGGQDGLKQAFGATVELGQGGRKADARGTMVQVRSLLVSGMREEVKLFRLALQAVRKDKSHDLVAVGPRKEDQFQSPAVLPGDSFRVRKTRSRDDSDQRLLSQSGYQKGGAPVYSIDMPTWSNRPMSEARRPTWSLTYWQGQRRPDTEDGRVVVDFAVHRQSWFLFLKTSNIQGIQADHSVNITTETTEQSAHVKVTIQGSEAEAIDHALRAIHIRWQHLVQKGTANTATGGSAEESLASVTANPASEPALLNDPWLEDNSPTQSYEEYAPGRMIEWECVVRKRQSGEGPMLIEILAPDDQWRNIAVQPGYVEGVNAISIDSRFLPGFHVEITQSADLPEETVLISIHGVFKQAYRMVRLIRSQRRRLLRKYSSDAKRMAYEEKREVDRRSEVDGASPSATEGTASTNGPKEIADRFQNNPTGEAPASTRHLQGAASNERDEAHFAVFLVHNIPDPAKLMDLLPEACRVHHMHKEGRMHVLVLEAITPDVVEDAKSRLLSKLREQHIWFQTFDSPGYATKDRPPRLLRDSPLYPRIEKYWQHRSGFRKEDTQSALSVQEETSMATQSEHKQVNIRQEAARTPSLSQSAHETMGRHQYIRDHGATHVENQETSHSEDSYTSAADPEEMKIALRTLTHPVVLITALEKDNEPLRSPYRIEKSLSARRGVTVSSFNTVTLDPVPMVSFNLKVPSRTWDAIQYSERICVHFISATAQGAALAQMFTRQYDDPSEPFRQLGLVGARAYVQAKRHHPPVIRGDCIQARLIATIEQRKCVQIGDHILVIARVEAVRLSDDLEDGFEVPGLAYAMRGYRLLGDQLEVTDVGVEKAKMEEEANEAVQQYVSDSTARDEEAENLETQTSAPPVQEDEKADEHATSTSSQDQATPEVTVSVLRPQQTRVDQVDTNLLPSKAQDAAIEQHDNFEATGLRVADEPETLMGDSTTASNLPASHADDVDMDAVVDIDVSEPQQTHAEAELASPGPNIGTVAQEGAQVSEDPPLDVPATSTSSNEIDAETLDERTTTTADPGSAIEASTTLEGPQIGENDVESASHTDVDATAVRSNETKIDIEVPTSHRAQRDDTPEVKHFAKQQLADDDERSMTAFYEQMSRIPEDDEDPAESSVANGDNGTGPAEEAAGLATATEIKGRLPDSDPAMTESSDRGESQVPPDEAGSDVEEGVNTSALSTQRRQALTSGKQQPWGVRTMANSAFSTLSGPSRRRYSSMSQAKGFSSGHRQRAALGIHAHVVDPSILTQTVAAFLGEPAEPHLSSSRPRMRAMLSARRASEKASSELETALASGSIEPELSARLENVVTRNEGFITKRLAVASARDLRLMLDTGNVVHDHRVQYLESGIEKGLAVLLKDAQSLRAAFEKRELKREKFEEVKKRLEEQYSILDTEAMRLRQMGEEGD